MLFFRRLWKVNPLSPWPIVSWLQITTASIILLVFGRTIGFGCASLLVSLDMLRLRPTLNTSFLPREEYSLNKLLDRFIPLELCVPGLSALTFFKNDFLCIILSMTVAEFSNITFSSFDCLSDVCFLIFIIHWFLAKITIVITLFIFSQFRVSKSNLKMASPLILARLTLTPFFSSGLLSVIFLAALSPPNWISLHDQRNSGPLNHLSILPRLEFIL